MAIQKFATFEYRGIKMRLLIHKLEGYDERGHAQQGELLGMLCEPVLLTFDTEHMRYDLELHGGGVSMETEADEMDRHHTVGDPFPSDEDWSRTGVFEFDKEQWMARAMNLSLEDYRKWEVAERDRQEWYFRKGDRQSMLDRIAEHDAWFAERGTKGEPVDPPEEGEAA